MIIRNEEDRDFRAVEELTKKAFWNIHVPGCSVIPLNGQRR